MIQSVLILGGSYFIGKQIALLFKQKGCHVSVLNRGTKSLEPGIEQISCDRNNPEQLKAALQNRHFDAVIDVSWKNPKWAEFLCDALCFDGVKVFTFISSSAVYDVDHLFPPYKETDPLAPNKYWTAYGAEKIEAEAYYKSFFSDKPARLVILRPPYVYGEDNYAQRESLMFKHLCEGEPILIPKNNSKLQFIHVKDLAQIVYALSENGREKVSIYNVGNKEPLTAKEWVEACAKAAGVLPRILPCDYQTLGRSERDFFPFYDYDNVLDVKKIKSIISQEIPMEEGLASAYRWYQRNKEQIEFNPGVEANIRELLHELRT